MRLSRYQSPVTEDALVAVALGVQTEKAAWDSWVSLRQINGAEK